LNSLNLLVELVEEQHVQRQRPDDHGEDVTMERVEISRDCDAIAIPAGYAVRLTKGTTAFITQALGGSYTLQVPEMGGLFRVAGTDADAIGKTPGDAPVAGAAAPQSFEDEVWAQLRTCYDPEIPVNIVDLGLVYDMRVEALPEGGKRVEVKMTLTAPGCGMGTVIAAEARQKIAGLPDVEEANVEVVWDPPWNPQMISPEGKERLGMM
jgi:probable FeS assembly SUF system protein SufT